MQAPASNRVSSSSKYDRVTFCSIAVWPGQSTAAARGTSATTAAMLSTAPAASSPAATAVSATNLVFAVLVCEVLAPPTAVAPTSICTPLRLTCTSSRSIRTSSRSICTPLSVQLLGSAHGLAIGYHASRGRILARPDGLAGPQVRKPQAHKRGGLMRGGEVCGQLREILLKVAAQSCTLPEYPLQPGAR